MKAPRAKPADFPFSASIVSVVSSIVSFSNHRPRLESRTGLLLLSVHVGP